MRLLFGLILVLIFSGNLRSQTGPIQIERGLLGEGQIIKLDTDWRMKEGDSLLWAWPDHNDGLWFNTSSVLTLEDELLNSLEKVAWFRKKIDVDENLVDVPLVMIADYLAGAMEIYIDGRLIYSIGRVGYMANDRDLGMLHRPRAFIIQEPGEHIIAVRYMIDDPIYYSRNGFRPGFSLHIAEANSGIGSAVQSLRLDSFFQYFFTGFLLAFSLLHALLFMYNTKLVENLYYALFALTLAIMNYVSVQLNYAPDSTTMVELWRLRYLLFYVTGLFILRFAYSFYYNQNSINFRIYAATGLLFSMLFLFNMRVGLFSAGVFEVIFTALLFLSFVEVMRVIIVSMMRKQKGVWVIGAGLTVFMVSFSFLALSANGFEFVNYTQRLFSVIGTLALLTSMSVYISYEVSKTQKDLETKLRELQLLSAKSLQQERINKEKEIERKLLEADNRRKTHELEEARALQLSMLPQRIPNIQDLEIAVHMSTATEVGGDYYDFNVAKDGSLTVAIGDVTGHGVKAGIIVATAKSYFLSLADRTDGLDMLRKMSDGIQKLNLRLLYMGLSLVKYNNGSYKLVAAGMPPALHYQHADKKVTQLVLKGLPLGGRDFPYKELSGNLQPGDVLLLMTDGLPELFNTDKEMLDYTPIESTLQQSASQPAEMIIESLRYLAEQWRGSRPADDDLTLVVIKRKSPTEGAGLISNLD
jgi:serine phosphatase RsbU (regulator of sigma subunit)